MSASKLKASDLWWHGPQWLTQVEKEEQSTELGITRTVECAEEEKKATVGMVETSVDRGIQTVIDITKYSKYETVIRVTAWVRRFIRNSKASTGASKTSGDLTLQEIVACEKEWVKSTQNEMQGQENFKQLSKILQIVKDKEGILRCYGRMENAELDIDTREPIILSKNHKLTELIVQDCHVRVKHCGVRSTLAELRSKYWVPKGRQLIKRILGKCVCCKRVQGQAYTAPPTAPLPEFRVKESPPFSKTGVDFAGPLYVKGQTTEMNKVYLALFTCCVTRAVHLDLIESMTVCSFMHCLRRFTARRGTPTLIVSDNAKTFQATDRALRKLYDNQEVSAFLNTNRIEWRFNLARSPWWGGFFERMIGMVKRCLKKVLGNARLTQDELSTILVEIEGTINNRPLTYNYDGPSEEVLTPAHLVYGRRINSLPDEAIVEEEDASCGLRYRYLSKKLEHFWKRWHDEYLVGLREFHKCKVGKGGKSVEVGDVVTVFEEGKKRGEWKMGVVVRLVKGRDGVVRGADVRVITKGRPKILGRPIQKLCPIEVRCKEERIGARIVPHAQLPAQAIRRQPRRNAALDARWRARLMLDS